MRPETNNKNFFRDHLLVGLGVFFIATLFFSIFKSADIYASSLFYYGDDKFVLGDTGLVSAIREVFKYSFILSCVTVILGTIAIFAFSGKAAARLAPKWIFMILCLSVGPGLVANVVFKGHWGRARPVHLEQFGGNKQYTLPLTMTDQCKGKNCSFVSGEASSIFSLFFALGLVAAGAWRKRLLLGGVAAGLASGLVRMAAGGHFLSDVVFAGIFMWLTTLLMWWVVFVAWPRRLRIVVPIRQLATNLFGSNHAGAREQDGSRDGSKEQQASRLSAA